MAVARSLLWLRRPSACAAAAAVAAAAIGGYAAFSFSAQPLEGNRLDRWSLKWESGQTRWHLPHVHPSLAKYESLLLANEQHGDESKTSSVFFPLCGASRDLGYMALRGHHVVGAEGVGKAIDQLFQGFGEETAIARHLPGLKLRKAATDGPAGNVISLEVVEGDFLELSASRAAALGLPRFDAAFDRGSLVAIQPKDRPMYAAVLDGLMAPGGRILLVTVEHDPFPNGTLGPPFSLLPEDVRTLFPNYEVRQLQRVDNSEDFKARGLSELFEVTYLLTKPAVAYTKANAAPTRAERDAALIKDALAKGRIGVSLGGDGPIRAVGPPQVAGAQVRS
uniref:Thiopurine S-methyltransferase n=1 Tax=Chrysotila carterae TaxID=13221 RepID=A0A7S4FAE0_CHRCT